MPETWGWAEYWADAARQQRLLRALLRDREALDEYLTNLICDEVNSSKDSKLNIILRRRDEEHLIMPVLFKLEQEDAAHFHRMIVEDSFVETTELFGKSFVVDWLSSSLVALHLLNNGTARLRE